ncbi:TetR/AcrR family transcriptional regulator [Spongiactinospora sp. 9N601]|uniref:TetR/AcrR family transcriptional regulator n=1 Tax=Spongiactinospora sp. 9N601 TaxID=3375149 RepID=UPI0037BDE72B
MTGLRERKKANTRRALIDVALRLFEEQGFAATTVQQIADEVVVSRKTFNRYFATKEDVVLAHEEQVMDDWLALLDSRPDHESALTALHRAARDYFTDPELDEAELQRRFRVQALMHDNPALMGENMRRFALREERLARHLADRSSIGIGLEARVLASVAFAAMRVALQEWAAGSFGDIPACLDLLDRTFTKLAGGLDLPPRTDPPRKKE